MKNRTLLIVIGVILLCCCAVIIASAVAYPTIKNYLNSASSGLQNLNPSATSSPDNGIATSQPSQTSQPSTGGSSMVPVAGGLGDPTLKADVWVSILQYENGQNCSDVTGKAIDVIQQQDSKGGWIENWTVDACGKTLVLKVTFTPDPKGGTNYAITSQ